MSKLIEKLGICALILGLQCGLNFSVVAAQVNEEKSETNLQAWYIQQDEIQSLRQEENRRHEQAMLQRANESVPDWQWRQWQEHEQYLKNMQDIQAYPLQLNYTPVDW